MHFKFDLNYVRRSSKHVAMIVANPVLDDSRVLKTAQTVSKLGYQVHLYGLSKTQQKIRIDGQPFEITLLPNPAFEMAGRGRSTDRQDFDDQGFVDIFTKYLQAELNQRPADFLHTHDMHGLAIGGRLSETAGKRFTWIHDIHEYIEGSTHIPDNRRIFYSRIEKKFIHQPNALTSVSPALNKILAKKYGLKKEPSLVLNAPRLINFDPYYQDIKTALGMITKAPLMVYNGNVNPVRGIQTTIDVLPLIPEVQLAIITNSSGRFIKSLQSKAQKLNVHERLHFHPYVPFYKVTSFIRTANIGLCPFDRYPNVEIALPTKLFEYLHAGLPTVVSNNQAMKEFVKIHNCGLFFEAGNARALAQAIKQVILRQKKEPNWSRSIQSLAKKYSWENQERIIAKIYDKLDRRQSYFPNPKMVPHPIDLKKWPYIGISQGKTLKLVHASSNREIKKTKFVLKAVEKLKSQGINIEYKLVENLPQNKAKELYKWADVVIDQLRIGWYGVLAVEAMALGKAVIAYIRDDLKHYLPNPLPLAIANPDNLYHILKDLALNKKKAREIGLRGRKYVEELHDADKVTDILLQIYQDKNAPLDIDKTLDMLLPQQKIIKKVPRRHIISKVNFIFFWRVLREHGLRSTIRKTYQYLKDMKEN